MKDMHGSITLEYTGILYAGVDREKKLRELAKVNPQEYCLAFMGHRTKRFFQWSGKMGERF